MSHIISQSRFKHTAQYIVNLQTSTGGIPWFEGGVIDPWNHMEAAMGLVAAGELTHASRAFAWLAERQNADGSWYAAYTEFNVADPTRCETNFVAYPATGLWHYYLATGDKTMLTTYWPMLEKALQWVVSLQSSEGEIYWAVDTKTGISHDALVTGCSSIYKSLECLCHISIVLGLDATRWHSARKRLGAALRTKSHRFDRTWPSKSRYSMDWFYPVLTNVVQGVEAKHRLDEKWLAFVEPNLGCRCVVEEPWVTVAETCELIMACVACGELNRAHTLFDWIHQFQLEDGSWWTGFAFKDNIMWPDERPTWTAGAVLLAADSLTKHSPTHRLFVHQPQPETL